MRLMQVRRKSWKIDVAMFLTLVMLFSPALFGLEAAWLSVATKASAQVPAPSSVAQPILVIPLTAAEGVPTNIAGRATFALIKELTDSKQYAPTRLSLEDPTVKRLISERLLSEDAITAILEQPTPEGIAEIAAAMKIPNAAFGTVDSYVYDPSNNGSVKIQLTVRFLTIDLEAISVTKTEEISEEGSSAPKLKPTSEDTLAAEAMYSAVKKIVAKLLGRPVVEVVEVKPKPAPGIGTAVALIAALLLAAAISSGREKAGPVPLGPGDAPRSVTAIPQGSVVIVSWQPPSRGTPVGYNVYRQAVDVGRSQSGRGRERLTTEPTRSTSYEDKTAQIGQAYIYSVSAVYPDGREISQDANLGIISPTQPAPVGVGIPLPPANLTAQALDGAVRVNWADLNPAGLVVGYRIFRNDVLIADENIVRTTTYIDRGLQNNVTYRYFVRAVSSFGFMSAPSATVNATPGNLAPQAPLNLTARFDPVAKTVTLTWQAPPDPDIAYYEVARISVEDIRAPRSLIERAGRPVPTPTTSPTIIQRVLQTNPRLRQQGGSEFDNAVIPIKITTTSFVDSVANFMPTPANQQTRYQRLRYAVRAVDTSGQRGSWSNVVEVTPNSPPPNIATPPILIPENGRIKVNLRPILVQADADREWQNDKLGVRIFRATVRGGTSAPALRPIHPQDVLPISGLQHEQNEIYYEDTTVVNGTRYYYAVELVDKLNVPSRRSPEAVATPFATATITITPQGNRSELSGNGIDSVQLTITAVDSARRPVAGLPVSVNLQGVGTLDIEQRYQNPYDPSIYITDENGQIIATYRTAPVNTDTTVRITVIPVDVTGVTPAELTLTLRAPIVASVEIQPQKTQLVADGRDTTLVTITVRDRLGQPVPNQIINLSVNPAQGHFENLQGNPISQVSSGSKGSVEVVYRSGTRAGFVTLTASVGAISRQVSITLIPGPPAVIDLVANPTVARADGQSEVRVTATVRDANGNAVPNAQVQFSATPTLTIVPSTVVTDSTGQAATIVTAPTRAGNYTLVAQVGNISNSITIVFTASSPTTITLSAERTQLFVTLPARYGNTDYSALLPFSQTIITAAVRDDNGNPVSGVVVSFSATFGIIQSTATTNEQGIARAVYNAPSFAPSSPVTINAQTEGGAGSSTLELTVIPGPPAKVNMTATPLALPADGRTSSQIRIEVRDANDNFVADGTQVRLILRPNIGSIQSPVATINGVANSAYIPSTQTGEVTIIAVAERTYNLDGRQLTFMTDPNDPNSVAQVRIFVGAQVQLVRTAPNFRTAVSVSSSASSDPRQRNSLRTRPPIQNTSDLTLQLVDGRGNNVALQSMQVRVRSSDPQVLFVELQGGQETGNASLQELIVLTDAVGRAMVRYYSSPIAGTVQVIAELLDPQGVAFSSDVISITQRSGDPASITVARPNPNLIFVPGAGTPTQATINAQVFDAVNNPVESGISVRFSASLAGRSVGIFTPTTTLTDSQGQVSTTLTSTPDTGIVTVTATSSVVGQQQPATGSNSILFVTGVTAITVSARDSRIGGAPNDEIPNSTVITAQFTGTIPNGTRVTFTTTRGTFDPQSQIPVRQQVVAVTNNTAQVTLHAETVTSPVIARVSVSALNAQGQTVSGSVDVTIVPFPGPIQLRDIQVENANLVVSTNNSTNPAARQPLDPNLPNSTAVTVSVREGGTNAPVPNASVTLSSDDANSLWVIGTTSRLNQIIANTDENGQIQAIFYTSTRAGNVTITATLDLGGGQTQQRQATITQLPGPPLLTLTTDRAEIFVRLPDNFNSHDYSQLPRSTQVTATVADANGNPYQNIVINFSTVSGIIANTATTDNNGEARVDYSSPVNVPANGQDTITAQTTVNNNTITNSATIRIRPGPPAQVNIAANPSELQPDGRSTSTVIATILDANNNPVRDGTQVTFELLQGSAQGTIWLPNRQQRVTVATANGQAQATLQAGSQSGVANIQVSSQESIQSTNYSAQATLGLPIGVALQLVQVDRTDISVSRRDYSSFGANYPNTAIVTVRLSTNVSGVSVRLQASDSGSRWRDANNNLTQNNTIVVTTNGNGQAQATYVASPNAGQVTVTATVGSQSQSVTITQRPGPMQITLQLQRPAVFVQLPAAYTALPQSTEVTVTTADENGNPYVDQDVQLVVTTNSGPTGSLAAASGRTNGQGRFVTTYNSPSQVPDIQTDGTGRATIVARSGGNQTQVVVQILPGPPALLTLRTNTHFVAPNGQATLTARVSDANGNRVRDGILVSFRLVSGPSDVVITPQNNGQVQNGQAQATLRAGATSGRAIVEAVAEQVENGNRFVASSQITLNVAATQPPVIVRELQVSPTSVVVSTSNAIDPAQRQPLDPARPNRARATVSVVDQDTNQPVSSMLVVFMVTRDGSNPDNETLLVSGQERGQGQITATTDGNGSASVDIYSPMRSGQVRVRASVDPTFPSGDRTREVNLTFEPGLPVLAVEVDRQRVRLEESSQVEVSIKDGNGNPFANQQVQVQVDQGNLADAQNRIGQSLTVNTDSNGEVLLTYHPPQVLPANRQATVTAKATVNGNNLTASAQIQLLPGVPALIQLSANPGTLPNDGQSTSVITATVTDRFGNPVEDGLFVNFSVTGQARFVPGDRTSVIVATVNGQAQATVRASTNREVANITAQINSVQATLGLPIGVALQLVQVEQTAIFVSKRDQNYSSFGANYPNTTTVTVRLSANVSGVSVRLEASDRDSRWRVGNNLTQDNTIVVTTGDNGQAQATYVASPTAGQVTITAILGTQTLSVTINQQPGPPRVTVNVNPSTIHVRLSGTQYAALPQQSQLTVRVADENNNPHQNAVVSLSATAGTLAETSGQTDAQGQFTTTLTAPTQVPTQNSVQITANATTVRGERASGSAEVRILPGPPAIVEISANRLILSATDNAQITVTVKDANGNIVPSGANNNNRTISVALTLQTGVQNNPVTINPTSGTTNENGQLVATLNTNDASADTVRINAEALEVLQGSFFRANGQLSVVVGIQATLTDLQITVNRLVVSNSNAIDPNQRQPLDPNRQNRTLVTITARLASAPQVDINVPVLLISSDDNTLWQDVSNPSRFAAKQLTINVPIRRGQQQGSSQANFYASTKRALNIPNEPSVAIRATLDPAFTDFNQDDQPGISITRRNGDGIIQEPGLPAKIEITLNNNFRRAPDGVPYLNIGGQGTITVAVTDANDNPVPNQTVNLSLTPDEGNLTPPSPIQTGSDGRAQVTLIASNFATELTLQARSGNITATQTIRYSVSIPGLNIAANPTSIPDDNTSTSLITVTSSAGDRPLTTGLRFRLSADLGATLSAGTEGADQANLVVAVGNGQPAGEGANEARATLKGPIPDLSQTQLRTITLTASLVVDGQMRTFTHTVTLLPRIQIVSDFGLSNNPNRLVVSSSNDPSNPENRQPLNGIPGHNKAVITLTINGAPPSNRLVTVSSTDPAVLFKVTKGSNRNAIQVGSVSGNLDGSNQYEVEIYSSTFASPSVTINFNVLGVNRSVTYEQVPGLPAQVTVSPQRFVIGVTGHPTLPTSTSIQAIVRDAAGNIVTTPGVNVNFTADAGTLNPTSAPATNGIAQTILTSNNETRTVRVFARAVAPGGGEAVGMATVIFAVGQVNLIELRANRPEDGQGNVPVPSGELVRVTAIFSPAGSVPNGVRVQVNLSGAYGIVQSVSPTSNNQCEIVILNNNTSNVSDNSRLQVSVYDQQGNLVSSPFKTFIMQGTTVQPVVSLSANPTSVTVSDNDSTDFPSDRRGLFIDPGGNVRGNVQSALTLVITGLNTNNPETVSATVRSSDSNGLLEQVNGLAAPRRGQINFNITDNGLGDTDNTSGVIRTTVNYYASRRAGTVVIQVIVNRNGNEYGRASITIQQTPGRVEQAFFTVDPPRMAVNTIQGEPVEARLIALLQDANSNPVPNEDVTFAIEPTQVVPHEDVQAGSASNVLLTRYDLTSLSRVFRAAAGGGENYPPVRQVIGVGNGVEQTFNATLLNPPIVANSVAVQSRVLRFDQRVIGQGDGNNRTFRGTLSSPVEPRTVNVFASEFIVSELIAFGDGSTTNFNAILAQSPIATGTVEVRTNVRVRDSRIIGIGDGTTRRFTGDLNPPIVYDPNLDSRATVIVTTTILPQVTERLDNVTPIVGTFSGRTDNRPVEPGTVLVEGIEPVGGEVVEVLADLNRDGRLIDVVTGAVDGQIDYDTGAYSGQFDSDVVTRGRITYSYRQSVSLQDINGDGNFSPSDPNECSPTFSITSGAVSYSTGYISIDFGAPVRSGEPVRVDYQYRVPTTLSDDGRGNISGTHGSGSINYNTGAISLNFVAGGNFYPPDRGSEIRVRYRSRRSVILTDDGNGNIVNQQNRIVGRVDYNTGEIEVTFDTPPSSGQDILVRYRYRYNAMVRDDGNGGLTGDGTGTINYFNGSITVNFNDPPAPGQDVVATYRTQNRFSDWGAGGVPREEAYLGFLRFAPFFVTPPPMVSDGSIYPQSQARTDANGIAITFFRSANVSQPVVLKMMPKRFPNLIQIFPTFYYVPVSSIQVTILEGQLVNGPGSTFRVAFDFQPASALPVGTRVWVRIHGTIYDGDEDGDGRVNEDPPGANNIDDDKDGFVDEDEREAQNPVDDDGDGREGEDPPGALSSDDDGDGRVDEDRNPGLFDTWFTATVAQPGRIFLETFNSPSGPDAVNGWRVFQVFIWNRDGIRLVAQTSAIEFR